ncbi:MAG: ATP-binding protein [Candidatus Brocadiaceae bacterium]|nr:ATP-binding protein [Candidatus Brocadiaceae bacterium]
MYLRNLDSQLKLLIKKNQSAFILGPRQTGKITLAKKCFRLKSNVTDLPLQNPEICLEMEIDPARLIKQLKVRTKKGYVFIDEAQKVPAIFDSVQHAIDEGLASFIITGSSARKLRRKGTNLLPGRVKVFRLDPMMWNEFGWLRTNTIKLLNISNINTIKNYSFRKSLIYGSLPGIVSFGEDKDRRDILKSYTYIYLEEEIRAEALSRKIGEFGRFLQLAAQESGTNPNFTKLSMEAGVSVPTIKEFYNLLEDTLVVEKIGPYLKNARKRILKSSRYYFFDIGVRNALARVPLTDDLINAEKGKLFEHAVILELIRRIRSLNEDYKLYYWRTAGGAEVDCVIETGTSLIPIEIKASTNVSLSDINGLLSFIKSYKEQIKQAYVVTNGRVPEKLSDVITAIPWRYL